MSTNEAGVQITKVPVVQRNLANGRLLAQRLDSHKAVQLSGSAPLIWDLLDSQTTVEGLVQELTDRFSDSPETIESGVRSALDSFVQQKLVVAR